MNRKEFARKIAEESIVLPPSIDGPGNYDGFRILLYPIKHQIVADSGFAILLAQWAQRTISPVGIRKLRRLLRCISKGFHQLFRCLRRTKMLRNVGNCIHHIGHSTWQIFQLIHPFLLRKWLSS